MFSNAFGGHPGCSRIKINIKTISLKRLCKFTLAWRIRSKLQRIFVW